MSDIHFLLECDERVCHIRDCNSRNGIWLNGEKVQVAMLQDGDAVTAGDTSFVVRLERDEPLEFQDMAATAVAAADRPIVVLRRLEFQPLFALLDAARDPKILELLRECTENYRSLYDGKKAEELVDFAPYLVRLPPDSPFLETLVAAGWGKSWGIYLTSSQPLAEIRRHFRHFLMVALEDGREVYFRFYDPRVLRIFLSACDAGEAVSFFGPVSNYLMEGETPEKLLRFRMMDRVEVTELTRTGR